MKKIYYQCRFTQTAPLRLSNGDSAHTDSDLMRDGSGRPFIPGSALAGVLRSMLCQKDARTLFGWLEEKTNSRQESRVQVSDASLRLEEEEGQAFHISTRHGVGIDERTGTAKDTAKYDFEVVETDGRYIAVLEMSVDESEGEQNAAAIILEGLMQRVAAEGISFGARTTRGYGSMNAEVFRREFALGKDASATVDDWLAFDPFDENRFTEADRVRGEAGEKPDIGLDVSAMLRMEGSFSVRVYSTEVDGPDMKPLESALSRRSGQKTGENPDEPKKTYAIPGTSWAGVFRHQMLKLARQAGMGEDTCKAVNELFGVTERGNPKRSRITFHETRIEGANELLAMRNALDRFTMAPRDKALFYTAVAYGGTGELRIRVRGELDEPLKSLLYAALLDLHNGLLTVGGEAGVGRGRASITQLTIDGIEETELLGNRIANGEGGDQA